MKFITVVFSLTLSVLASCTVLADTVRTPYIQVMGVASTDVTPDLIHWSLKVNNHGYQLDEVARNHQKIVSNALKVLQTKSIKKDSLQTSNMQFGEKTKYDKNNRVNDGYFASTNIQFTLVDLDQYQAIWQALAQIKGLSINSANFDYSKRKSVGDEMRLQALINARNKAEKMAETLNVSIAEPIAIQDTALGTNPSSRMRVQAMEASSSRGTPPIAAGKITISAQVSVEFMLMAEINIKKK